MSGWFTDAGRTVKVELGECLCPGTPHPDGDSVELNAELDLKAGFGVVTALAEEGDGSAVERLGRAYLKAGIVSWTFVEEGGAPVPVTPENIDRLRWSGGTYLLADRAADLYGEAILSPLVRRVSASSPNGRSAGSTSPTRGS